MRPVPRGFVADLGLLGRVFGLTPTPEQRPTRPGKMGLTQRFVAALVGRLPSRPVPRPTSAPSQMGGNYSASWVNLVLGTKLWDLGQYATPEEAIKRAEEAVAAATGKSAELVISMDVWPRSQASLLVKTSDHDFGVIIRGLSFRQQHDLLNARARKGK